MVVDIAKFFLDYMRAHGYALDDSIVDMILHSYYENALAFIKSYSDLFKSSYIWKDVWSRL